MAKRSVIKVAGVNKKIKSLMMGATVKANLSAWLKAYVLGITSAKITSTIVNNIVTKIKSNSPK